jgi:hypothetical protein
MFSCCVVLLISHTRAADRERHTTRQGDRGTKATPEGGGVAAGTKASRRTKQPDK